MEDRTEILARRARRFRSKGELRKAANTYGELTSVEPHVPRWWVLLGVCLGKLNREESAVKALRQASFLYKRNNQCAKEQVIRTMLIAHGA